MFSFFLVLQSFVGFLTSWLCLCSSVHRNHSRECKEITNTANTQTKTTTSTVVGLFLQLHHHHHHQQQQQQRQRQRQQQQQQGNRLTRRPCKGDKFEIEIFEAKRQNAGICGTCQKVFATWTFISIGRCVTQFKKCISNARRINFDLRVLKKHWEFMIFKFPMQTSTRSSTHFLDQCQSAFGKATATDSNEATL